MKTLSSYLKKSLFLIFTIIAFSSMAFGVQIANDRFDTDLDGWSGTGVSWDGTGNKWMRIARDRTASKTYNFGAHYANQTLTIKFSAWVPNPWETSDDFNVLVNSSVAHTYTSGGGVINKTFTATADASGSIKLGFNPDTSADDEPAYVDWITIDGTPSKQSCPGLTVQNINNATSDASMSYSETRAVNESGQRYYYTFATAADGEMTITQKNNRPQGGYWNHRMKISDSACGGNNIYNGVSFRYDSHTFSVTAGTTYYVFVRETNSQNQLNFDITFDFVVDAVAPTLTGIPDQSIAVDTPFTFSIASYATGGDLTYTATGLPPGLAINPTSGVISGTPTAVNSYTVTATATNTEGSASDDFVITVSNAPINATNNVYSTVLNSAVYGNVMTDDTGSGVDTGDAIYVSTNTNPSNGTVTVSGNGDFAYTPDADYSGSDTFTYTITDGSQTDTATVTINVAPINTSGDRNNFHLVNTPNSRNIIGNYKIAGNTVLCLTERTEGYGGTCHGMGDYQYVTSNNQVVKYIDIDSDVSTWNSSSSFINVDNSYDKTQGVVWAGLFWGGRLSTDKDHTIRYYTQNAGVPTVVNIGRGTAVNSVNTAAAGGNRIRLSINNSAYNEILASEFHRQPDNVDGETYEAYADVTSIVGAAITEAGKYTFRVANLTTMEGREDSPGAFGGWSLVVIYADDYTLAGAKPRNISIYNGFLSIQENDAPITISGFKLPSVGLVQANLSIFSGEGEYLYGYNDTPSNSEDWIKISDVNGTTPTAPTWNFLPGLPTDRSVGNQRNIFDAVMAGILRDPIPGEFNNLSTNNVGVEVDNYDVSTLMTAYRNNNPNINQAFLQTYSDNDYVTVNMIAFSAELYIPELCYDYTLDIGGHVLDSVDNEIKTPFGGYGIPLTTTIFLRSLDGDIDLSDVNVNYNISDSSQLQYSACSTEISENGQFDYNDACAFTYNESVSGYSMYIGTGKTPANGGVIAANESRYIKWDSDFKTNDVDTDFTFSANFTVNYGSGAVPLTQDFTADDLCPTEFDGYLPKLGLFNVVDPSNDYDIYNLYTQVSKRPFGLTVYAYSEDHMSEYPSPEDLNFSVEVEMIRADDFMRDADTACNNAASWLSDVPRKSTHFSGVSSAPISYAAEDLNISYRSVAMRVWYLGDIDEDGNELVVNDHNCSRDGQDGQTNCEELYAKVYATYGQCDTQCASGAAWSELSNCYTCLRTNYGRKVCSRDNFAIRPEAFIARILDSNQSKNIDDPANLLPSDDPDNPAHVVAGYDYRFDVNATDHTDGMGTRRYIQHFEPGSAYHEAVMRWEPNEVAAPTNCNDEEDRNIDFSLFNGTNVNYFHRTSYIDRVSQVGEYTFEIYDQNWTSVDWNNDDMLHHYGALSANFKSGGDCVINDTITLLNGALGRNGCKISSKHKNNETGKEYTYHYAHYYPYTFRDVLSVIVGAGTSNLIFINSPSEDDKNMSYNIQGTFGAEGKDGNLTNNFVAGCYAEDVDMSLYQHYTHATPPSDKTPYLSYDLIDFNTTDHSVIIRPREQGTFDKENNDTKVILDPLTITQGKEYFATDMNGTITMDLGYNFMREYNNTLNPRKITMVDFNLTFTTNPTNLMVDLETNYQIVKEKSLDQNLTFVYGRVKSSKPLYDDVTDNNITTPISVVMYCDLGMIECATRDINATTSKPSNEVGNGWYTAILYNNMTNSDGTIGLASTSAPTPGATVDGSGESGPLATTDTRVDINTEGINNLVNVSAALINTRPLSVDINFNTTDGDPDMTDTWLIYNEDANSIPSPFYRVRFVDPNSDWAGFGNTGHVVDDGASYQKNKRLGW